MTKIRLSPAEPHATMWEVLKYVYAYFTILTYIHALLCSVFLSVVCYMLKREFEDICEKLQTLSADEDGSWKDGEVERLRRQHDKVCQATWTADRVISYLVFGIYLGSMLLVCFCISCFTQGYFPSEGIPTLIAVSVSTFGQAVITSVFGVMLNHQAHRPRDILPRIGVAKLSQEDYRSLLVFLGQVSGRRIGITAMGLFTVNRPALITIIGTIVAYAIVIQQLGVNKVGDTGSVSNVTVSSNTVLDTVSQE
ncbi:uncharacterized protein LOC124270412 [Haliotis rubra]|uniref:uncharacterized protein LOC124270412 n=1 Tax=Haliotis rubra TaxID=36100 RepID=UPI001EE50BAA|nr:uncharacterized protein LOC124270412 [Haliotis rubra]